MRKALKLIGFIGLMTVLGALGLSGCTLPVVSVSPDLERWAVVLDGGGYPRLISACLTLLSYTQFVPTLNPQELEQLCSGEALYLFRPEENRLEPVELPPRFLLAEAAWDGKGRGLLLAGLERDSGRGQIYLYDPERRAMELVVQTEPPPEDTLFPYPRPPQAPSLSPDGRRIAYLALPLDVGVGRVSELRLHDRATGELIGRLPGAHAYEWLPGGSSLLAFQVDPFELEPHAKLLRIDCHDTRCTVAETLWVFPPVATGSLAERGLADLPYRVLPPRAVFDLSPDGREVAVVLFFARARGGSLRSPSDLVLENRLYVISLASPQEERWVRQGALLPRYSPSGAILAALSEVEPEFRSQPDRREACLAAEIPELEGTGRGGPEGESAYLCLRRGNLVVLRDRETSESRVLELPTAPMELFWASDRELGYGYLRGAVGSFRLLDLETGRERDLTARWRKALAALPSRTLQVPEEYSTIQGAIDAARPRDTVRIAPGVYREDLLITKDLRLEGAEGVEIRGNVRVIAPAPREVTLRRLRILAGRGDGLAVRGPVRLTLEGVSIVGAKGNGLSLQGGTERLALRDVQISSNEGCGVWVDDEGARVSVEGSLEMRGNGVDLCGYAPIALRRPLVPPTDRSLVRVPEDYESVQEAVDAVAPGGVVELGPETYREGLTLWKPLTLRGAGWGRTKLEGTGRLTISVPAGVEGVRLEGLTLQGGLGTRDGLWAYGGVTLEGVRVQSAQGAGVMARGRARLAVRNSQFFPIEIGIQAADDAEIEMEGVQVRGVSRAPLDYSVGTGLELSGRARLFAQDLEIRHLLRGVQLCAADPECEVTLRLVDAQLERNGLALDLGGRAEAVVQNATLRRNGGLFEVIRLGDLAKLTLEESKVVEGFGPAIHTDLTSRGARLILRRVRVAEHEVGLRLQGSFEVHVEDSQILENRSDGLEAEAFGSAVFGGFAARLRLERTEIAHNGTDPSCARPRELCVGLEVRGSADVEIRASRVLGNADWGIAAYLTRCGYPEDDFHGRIAITENSLIEGNNATGNHEGEICL